MSAHSRFAIVVSLFALGDCASLTSKRVRADMDDERPAVVQVINRTTEAYRMSVVAGQTTRPLGIVPAQEIREFQVPLWIVRTYDEIFLIATARDNGGDERASLQFHAAQGRIANWTLDATRLRTVLVR